MGLVDDARRRAQKTAHSTLVSTAQRVGAGFYLRVDYPPAAENAPRYGYGRPPHEGLNEIIRRGDERYAETLKRFAAYGDDLAQIAIHATDPDAPSWITDFIPGLDGAALYGFLRDRKPAEYMEIGSGNSTKFVARARRDEGCSTRLTSIDPYPRAEIDTLCDEVIRRPLESVDLAVFDRLRAGDILFFDGSHRVFMNSDVVAFFLDVLPKVPPGVLVGVHDIYLPDDYPPAIAERWYSEQYPLAMHVLRDRDEIELPAHYVSRHPQLSHALDEVWGRPELAHAPVQRHGVAFWFTTRA
jgi:hypothetical protein